MKYEYLFGLSFKLEQNKIEMDSNNLITLRVCLVVVFENCS